MERSNVDKILITSVIALMVISCSLMLGFVSIANNLTREIKRKHQRVELPEEWMEISRDSEHPTLMRAYIKDDGTIDLFFDSSGMDDE